ncbi:helicase C-terminal domain protein [Aeromicrobium marinum DSM 15272]|uniref:Helicase C-terminal domain protein n=1 Tax=Aeromicrobium marinum DSM 15272 TaxID=585531 RepID=E2SBT4_9ACTN|nr:DEAD/DEAH box helicase [Aeromicrobium marinum]EFQ83220.1 helicase C-terminal domain protein [Aeromicrobium marinum DSM 15272]
MIDTLSAPDIFTGSLEPHQLDAADWLMDHPRALLADDVGLGKTVEAIAYIARLDYAGELPEGRTSVIWITEASLLKQTAEEFARFAPSLAVLTSDDRLFEPGGSTLRWARFHSKFPSGVDVVVVSHELAGNRGSVLNDRFGTPPLVVIDEAMALKSGGPRHTRISEITAAATRVLAMTATPYENSPLETYNILRLLHLPDLWTSGEFDSRFVEWAPAYQIPGTWKTVPARPLGVRPEARAELAAYLHKVMLRRTVEDIGGAVPVRVGEQVRWVELSSEQADAYDVAAQNRGGVGHIRRTVAARGAGDSSALVDEFMRYLDSPKTPSKVIVYCETLGIIHMVCERLEAAGIGHVSIEGANKAPDRTIALAAFRDRPEVRVLVGSKVLELGLNIQHCNALVTLDCSDNPQRERQREGRIRRLGSPHETYTHLTLMPETPTARKKWQTLERKRREAEALLRRQDNQTTDPTTTYGDHR